MRLYILMDLKFLDIKLNENPCQKFIRTDRRGEAYVIISKKKSLQTPLKPFSEKELYETYSSTRLFSDRRIVLFCVCLGLCNMDALQIQSSPDIAPLSVHSNIYIYRMIKKSLCTWWLQYTYVKLQIMFRVLGSRPPGPRGHYTYTNAIPYS
jgi:hypothetical protein